MASTAVAKRYAKALLELGVERKCFEALNVQLQQLAKLYEESADLKNVLLNPGVRLHERMTVVRTLAEQMKWEPILLNFVLLLIEKDRFRHVKAIAREFQHLADEQAGNVRVHVTSARPLSDDQQSTIRNAIASKTGKNVLLDSAIDPELIGGVVTRVGSTVYDGSVRTQLNRMRESILKEV